MTQEGATTVRLIVQQQNPRARRFWERQGFTVEREMMATAGKLESPVWLLRRDLQAPAAHAVAAQQGSPCR
jgi:ribosomal protein S18 acetylase RimI-like enzyme